MENVNLNPEEQITVKDFFKKIFTFFKQIAKNWQLVGIGLTLGALVVLIQEFFTEEKQIYRAAITFNLDLDGQNNQSFGGFASSLGLPTGVSGGDFFSAANFETIIQSKIIYERLFMKEIKVGPDSTKMLFANYYKDSSDIVKKEWAGSLFREPYTTAIDYRFTKKKPEEFSGLENQIIQSMYEKLNKSAIVFPIENSTLINLAAETSNEYLSLIFVNLLLEITEEFYIETKTKKSRALLKIQERRLDSLSRLVNSSDRRVADLGYDQQYVVERGATSRQIKSTRDNNLYSTQYIAQLNNIEGIKRVIMEQTPIFTKLDIPRLPLENGYEVSNLNIKLGSLLGLIFVIIFLVLKDMYKEIMDN